MKLKKKFTLKKKIFKLKKNHPEEVKIQQVPTMNYHYQVPAKYQYSPDNRPTMIQAAYADIGTMYVNHGYGYVMELLSKDMMDTGDIRVWKLKFKAYDFHGDVIEVNTNGTCPLIIDHKAVEELMDKYIQGVNIMAEKKGSKIKTSIDKSTGKVVKKGGEKKVSSVAVNPKTGCRVGTTADIVGNIMLKVKEGADHRKNALPLIQAELEDQGFDVPKAKTLAASWYSTLVNRKAEIYGKFKTSGATKAKAKAAPVKEKAPAKKLKLKKA